LWKTQERGLDKGRSIHKQEHRGVKTIKSTPGLAAKNPGNKSGRKKKNELFMECGKLMIDSGKMKDLTSYSFTNI